MAVKPESPKNNTIWVKTETAIGTAYLSSTAPESHAVGEVAPTGEYREIKDNMLSTEAFAKDEIGWYQTKDNLWKSMIDANAYTPESYPAGWEKVTE